MVDGKATEDRDGDWVGHIAPETTRGLWLLHCAGGERIIRDNAIIVAHNERAGRTARLIGTGAATKPIIKFRNARAEIDKLVMFGQGRGCTEGHASSTTLQALLAPCVLQALEEVVPPTPLGQGSMYTLESALDILIGSNLPAEHLSTCITNGFQSAPSGPYALT